jgi:hypothetical protein
MPNDPFEDFDRAAVISILLFAAVIAVMLAVFELL